MPQPTRKKILALLSFLLFYSTAQCNTQQVASGLAEIKAQTKALEKKAKSIKNLDSHIAEGIVRSDSLWQRHVQKDCALKADIASLAHADSSTKPTIQENNLGIAACMVEAIRWRKAHLDSLSQKLDDL